MGFDPSRVEVGHQLTMQLGVVAVDIHHLAAKVPGAMIAAPPVLHQRDQRPKLRPAGEESVGTLAAPIAADVRADHGVARAGGSQHVVEARPNRGYLLRRNSHELDEGIELPPSSDERLYLQIVRDYLSGVLPKTATETDFMRRYDASRHLVLATLALLSEEGIVHRGKGREWQFRDVLKSSRSREEIELVFDRNKGAIYALYNRALRDNPSLQGKVVLELTIAPWGEVTNCRVLSSDLNDPELERKLIARVKLFRFEERDVEAVTTTKPIDFFPA